MLLKKIFLFLVLTSLSTIVTADDEFVYKEVLAPDELNSVDMGAPLIASKVCSHAEMLYLNEFLNLTPGDLVTKLSFNGYNPGEPFTRHFIVWMSNTYQRKMREQTGLTPTENMTKVFEGDCTIASGGSEEERIPLLTITLHQPFEYGGFTMKVIIESTGETTTQEVCFEHYKYGGRCCYATADDIGNDWGIPEYDAKPPLTTLTIATPVINLTGLVSNQDGEPIPDAQIQLTSTDWPSTLVSSYKGVTDSQGHYAIRIEEGNKYYMASVSAPDCADYVETWLGTHVKEKTQWDFTLYDAVEYKAGRRATIIMPVAPEAKWGRYYRMDRIEGGQLIFERELSPQANVPYVIFPDIDFLVDLSTLDLTMQAGMTSIPCVDFVGSYINYDFPTNDNQELIFMDETPDGGYEYYYDDYGGYYYIAGGRIAALRACIIEDLWYGKDVVFLDSNGITYLSDDKTLNDFIYDLQGRRVTEMKHGIYIKDGRKIIK